MATRTKVLFDSRKLHDTLSQKLIAEQTRRLLAYAEEELEKMAQSHAFINRTYNLEDSYVWSVFYNTVRQGYGFYGAKKATEDSRYNEQDVDGRHLADKFSSSYRSTVSNGWEVVWAATAPYASALEMGKAPRRRSFEVVSQRYDHIRHKLMPYCRVTIII